MNTIEIEGFLKSFRWDTLHRMYGNAHNSIIGFIASEWINQSKFNSILDGAPSPKTGKGRIGQKNADILLCKGHKPLVVVEVETGVSKYSEKVDSIWDYLHNKNDFNGIELGLLIMTNGYAQSSELAYKHNWDSIKKKVKRKKSNMALVSIEKCRVTLDDSVLDNLRRRNQYYPWDIAAIDYWIFDGKNSREGNLWKQ